MERGIVLIAPIILLILVGLIGLFIWLIRSTVQAYLHEGLAPRLIFTAVLIAVIGGLTMLILQVRHDLAYAPPTQAIDDELQAADPGGRFTLHAVHIPQLTYTERREGAYAHFLTRIRLQATNHTDESLFLGVHYSYHSGTTPGIVQHGAGRNGQVVQVAPAFSGPIELLIQHTRFANGGTLSFEIGLVPEGSPPPILGLPAEAAFIARPRYTLVP